MHMEEYLDLLKVRLREEGLKLTPQRRSIIEVLVTAQGSHLSCEEIYDEVKVSCPEIGLATVYRTLQLLDKINFTTKLNLDDGCVRYELNMAEKGKHQHHHLVCQQCGSIIEVKMDLLDELERTISKEYDFVIQNHDLKFYGICKKCKE